MQIDPIVRLLVDRCHAADSYRDVLAYVISRLRDRRATWRSMSRASRRALMEQVKARHLENRKLYVSVVTGRF